MHLERLQSKQIFIKNMILANLFKMEVRQKYINA